MARVLVAAGTTVLCFAHPQNFLAGWAGPRCAKALGRGFDGFAARLRARDGVRVKGLVSLAAWAERESEGLTDDQRAAAFERASLLRGSAGHSTTSLLGAGHSTTSLLGGQRLGGGGAGHDDDDDDDEHDEVSELNRRLQEIKSKQERLMALAHGDDSYLVELDDGVDLSGKGSHSIGRVDTTWAPVEAPVHCFRKKRKGLSFASPV